MWLIGNGFLECYAEDYETCEFRKVAMVLREATTPGYDTIITWLKVSLHIKSWAFSGQSIINRMTQERQSHIYETADLPNVDPIYSVSGRWSELIFP